MKKLAAILCLSALTTGAFAQGLVQFFPTPSTLSSATVGGVSAATSGAAGSYFYGLLTAGSAAGPFSFSGVYATNRNVAGYFGSPAGITVPGWPNDGTTVKYYEVAVWSASLGATWNSSWVNAAGTGLGTFTTVGNFGLSGIGSGIAGGVGTPATPAFSLFGGASGIQNGFNAGPVGAVPEPTSMALAGLGAAALLIFRRRK
jgi:hypothetical protein